MMSSKFNFSAFLVAEISKRTEMVYVMCMKFTNKTPLGTKLLHIGKNMVNGKWPALT